MTPAMAFTGFKKDGIAFFKELALRQDRDWFKAQLQGAQERLNLAAATFGPTVSSWR